MDNEKRLLLVKKWTFFFAMIGFGIPFLILVVDWITKGWYPTWITYIWPTWIMLIPYGGTYFSFDKLLCVLTSALLNALLYAVIGLGCARLAIVITRRPFSSHSG